ncbi:MAG: glycine--tRNA ligase subunit beta [Candidatus Bipolaricaulaceae bacterium]
MKLLFEVGTEELPALQAPQLAEALREGVRAGLAGARLEHGEIRAFWTARRLALLVEDLAAGQRDQVEEVRGPAAAVGLDAAGQLTRAGEGFLRAQGGSPEQLFRRAVGEREYLFLRRRVVGRPAQEVLPELLAAALEEVPCSPRMRWDDSGVTFLRPIRWLVCLLGEEVLPVRVGKLVAGRTTRGHRFFGPRFVELACADDYVERLHEARVLCDPGARRSRVTDRIQAAEQAHAARAAVSEELLGRIVGGAEWPVGVEGSLPEGSSQLPAAVVEATLREEGKFVPFSHHGQPATVFLGFRDGAEDVAGVVRQGYERVVQARLRDSAFFFQHDRRRPLADRVRDLREIVYEARLGTLWQRVERIRALAERLARLLDLPAEALDRAAFLCKADVTCELVREFPELEGVLGGIYAALDGEAEEVSRAIGEHLRPRSRGDALPETPLGTALSLADKLDAVAGAIRVGEVPTGSRDPYGIRRRGAAVVRLLVERRLPVDVLALLEEVGELYPQPADGQPPEAVAAFLVDRLRAALAADYRLSPDVVAALLAEPRGTFLDIWERGRAVERLRGDPALSSLCVAFGRVRNITKGWEDSEFDPQLFAEEAERELWRAYLKAEGHLRQARQRGDHEGALRSLLPLTGPIDRYFDQVLVMAEEPAVRHNRLSFLRAVVELFLEIGDLSLLVTP